MKSILVACFLMLVGGAAFAGETCEVAKKVDGRLVYEAAPCVALDVPQPCYETRRDEQGHTIGEMRPCRPGEQRSVQQSERDRELAQKQACGRDFGALRVGMRVDRFEKCTDGLSFLTDTVMKGRVVETYRSTFYLVHASDGVIVAFSRLTN